MLVYEELRAEVFHILNTHLPPFLTYHSPEHTAYVLEKAEFISRHENVSGHDLLLIRIAALFHDIGFIEHINNHEERGCEICTEKLIFYHFPYVDIRKVCGMIMATKIPQQPSTLAEKIVADADLEYLGTDDFYRISQTLFHEFKHFRPDLTLDQFNQIQIRFMSDHHYHTDYCRRHREAKKQENLQALLDRLEP